MSLYDEIRPVRRQDPREGLSRWDRRLLEALSLDHWRQLGHIHAGLRRDEMRSRLGKLKRAGFADSRPSYIPGQREWALTAAGAEAIGR